MSPSPPSIKSVKAASRKLLAKVTELSQADSTDVTALRKLREDLDALLVDIEVLEPELKPRDRRWFHELLRLLVTHLGIELIKYLCATQFYLRRLLHSLGNRWRIRALRWAA